MGGERLWACEFSDLFCLEVVTSWAKRGRKDERARKRES